MIFSLVVSSSFIFPLYKSKVAVTAEDHLQAGEAYALRGQIFGDPEATFQQYTIAAKMGLAEAQYRVGSAYLYRHYNRPYDLEVARHWLKQAAQQGDKKAQNELANPYHFKDKAT